MDINWKRYNETKWHFVSTVGYGLTKSAIFPLSVIKTRMQNEPTQTTFSSVVKELLTSDGNKGLFKGSATTVTSTVLCSMIYLGTIEKTQQICYNLLDKLPIEENKKIILSSAGGSMASSLISQSITIPGDIITKNLMIQGGNDRMTGVDVVRKIIKKEGIKGLYKGYGIPPIIPNIIWWASYNAAQNACQRFIQRDEVNWKRNLLCQAAGGFMAGALTSMYTHPFDTVTTKMQLNNSTNKTATQMARDIFKQNGIKGFYRGYGPAVGIVTISSVAYAVLYEYFKL